MARLGLTIFVLLAVAGCAGSPTKGELRQYTCDDGTAFSLEVAEAWVRLHTATGTIELPRVRSDQDALYTNGLRSVIIEEGGRARHALGRRAWAVCTA